MLQNGLALVKNAAMISRHTKKTPLITIGQQSMTSLFPEHVRAQDHAGTDILGLTGSQVILFIYLDSKVLLKHSRAFKFLGLLSIGRCSHFCGGMKTSRFRCILCDTKHKWSEVNSSGQ